MFSATTAMKYLKYFREQMFLATKDEAGVHLDQEENDFMLDNAYG
ncbi:hypothetical protein Tco_0638870, partial [Tanacetum coccineum]